MGDHTNSQITYRGAAIRKGATDSECRWVAHVPDGDDGHTRVEADSAQELMTSIDETLDGRAQ